jgi:hypothetical protein
MALGTEVGASPRKHVPEVEEKEEEWADQGGDVKEEDEEEDDTGGGEAVTSGKAKKKGNRFKGIPGWRKRKSKPPA